MAAILAEIKSRLLLPRPPDDAAGGESDPRAELVRRLQEYERYKRAAEDLDALPRVERDTSVAHADAGERNVTRAPPAVDLRELLLALKDVLRRAELGGAVAMQRDALSIRERMSDLLRLIEDGAFHAFTEVFKPEQGRLGIVVSFIAMLELIKEGLLDVIQDQPLAPIYLKACSAAA